MKESSGYQLILAEGRGEGRAEGTVQGAKAVLLTAAEKRYGPPDATTQAALDDLHDLESIQQLAERLFAAKSWQELLTGTAARRRGTRRKKPS